MRKMYAEISSASSSETTWIDALSNFHGSEISADEILKCLPHGTEKDNLRALLAEYDDIYLANVSFALNESTNRWLISDLLVTRHEHVLNVAVIVRQRLGDITVPVDRHFIEAVNDADHEELGLIDDDDIQPEPAIIERVLGRLITILGAETRVGFAAISLVMQIIESELIHDFELHADD